MAFVLEDGSGKADANSYLSVADLRSILSDHQDATDVQNAEDQTLEKALVLATTQTDARNHGVWKGRRTHETQALDWPRDGVVDSDDYTLANDALPARLRIAVAFRAHAIFSGALLADERSSGAVEEVGAGPAKVRFSSGGSPRTSRLRDDLLDDYLLGGAGSGQIFLQRA